MQELDASAVYLAAVSNSDHYDKQHVVDDRIDHAVVTNPDAQTGAPRQCARARWAWVLCEQRDSALDSQPVGTLDLAERLQCRRALGTSLRVVRGPLQHPVGVFASLLTGSNQAFPYVFWLKNAYNLVGLEPVGTRVAKTQQPP